MYVGLLVRTKEGVEGAIFEIKGDMVTISEKREGRKEVVLREDIIEYFDFSAPTMSNPFGSWVPIEELGKTKGRKLTPDGKIIED